MRRAERELGQQQHLGGDARAIRGVAQRHDLPARKLHGRAAADMGEADRAGSQPPVPVWPGGDGAELADGQGPGLGDGPGLGNTPSRALLQGGSIGGHGLLEVPGARRSPVFEQARDDYEADRARPQQAIEAHALRLRDDPAWHAARAKQDPATEVLKLLQARFAWNRKKPGTHDPLRLLDQFLQEAFERHRQHLAAVHPSWSQRIGLRLARRGVGTWYAPSDPMLRALVLTTVRGSVEYRQFLSKLYERYGLVFGVAEAERAFDAIPADHSAFAENTARLEARLRDLGLLERLSDDCAYVRNPFETRA